jgi:regulator of replication initiation timing
MLTLMTKTKANDMSNDIVQLQLQNAQLREQLSEEIRRNQELIKNYSTPMNMVRESLVILDQGYTMSAFKKHIKAKLYQYLPDEYISLIY